MLRHPNRKRLALPAFSRHKSDKQKTPAQVVEQSGTAEPVVSVMEDEGDPFANARVHPSPAPAPVPIGQQPPAKAIPTMEPVVVSTPAEQPENAPVPAAVNTPAQGTAPVAAPAVQEPLTKRRRLRLWLQRQLRSRQKLPKIWREARRNTAIRR